MRKPQCTMYAVRLKTYKIVLLVVISYYHDNYFTARLSLLIFLHKHPNLAIVLYTLSMLSGQALLYVCFPISMWLGLFFLQALYWGGVLGYSWFFNDIRRPWALEKRTNGYRQFCLNDPNEKVLYDFLEKMAKQLNIPVPTLLESPERGIEAYSLYTTRQSYILLSQGLLKAYKDKSISREMVLGTIGHEIGHIYFQDSQQNDIYKKFYTANIIFILGGALYGVLFASAIWMGVIQLGVMVAGAAFMPPIFHKTILRAQEYRADSMSAKLLGSPDGVIQFLKTYPKVLERWGFSITENRYGKLTSSPKISGSNFLGFQPKRLIELLENKVRLSATKQYAHMKPSVFEALKTIQQMLKDREEDIDLLGKYGNMQAKLDLLLANIASDIEIDQIKIPIDNAYTPIQQFKSQKAKTQSSSLDDWLDYYHSFLQSHPSHRERTEALMP